MKLNILHILGVATTLLAAGCAQEELQKTDTEKLSELAISVTDGGYISEDTESDAPTRITDNDYRTEFTAGDVCGLYIVRDGRIIAENIKLTAAGTGSNVTWSADADNEPFGGLPNEDYYLYYPYQESMDGEISPAATTDADFFAPLIKDWQPQADQSDYETGYAASDLMTAEGIITEKGDGTLSLSFSMTHRMAMAVVQMPEVEYVFTNTLTTGYKIPNYKEFPYAEFSGDVKPYGLNNGMYRYIFNPQQTGTVINGHYKIGDYRSFTVDIDNINAGKYKTFNIESASLITVNYELTAGDFLCKKSDTNKWYIIPKSSMPNNEDFVGVVFYVGHNTNDDTNYSNTGIGKQQCNGYVMAVKNLEEAKWINSSKNYVTSTDAYKWNGFSNYWNIINYGGGLNYYPAAKVCKEYSPTAPQNTSNWYFPSRAQMLYILQNLDSFKQSVELFNESFFSKFYWTSTTSPLDENNAEVINVNNSGMGNKSYSIWVCPILSF